MPYTEKTPACRLQALTESFGTIQPFITRGTLLEVFNDFAALERTDLQ